MFIYTNPLPLLASFRVLFFGAEEAAIGYRLLVVGFSHGQDLQYALNKVLFIAPNSRPKSSFDGRQRLRLAVKLD